MRSELPHAKRLWPRLLVSKTPLQDSRYIWALADVGSAESLGRKQGQKQENLQAMTGQKARAEKAPDPYHQDVLTEEGNIIDTEDVSQTFWSPTYSKGKYIIM